MLCRLSKLPLVSRSGFPVRLAAHPSFLLHPLVLLPPQLLALLRSSAPYVRSEADWRTVCAIIKLTSGVCSCPFCS